MLRRPSAASNGDASPLAALRLRQIASYLRSRNPQAALGVQQAVRDTFALLAEHPNADHEVHPEVRRFVLPRLP